LLAVIGVVVALLAIAYGASVSPFLAVDHVVVRGASRTTPRRLLHDAGIAKGDPLFWFDAGNARTKLEAEPFVARARVIKEWPDTLRIVVTERTPAAWAEGARGIVVVDGTGRVLEHVGAAPAGLPQLLGLRVVPDPGGTVAPTGPARMAAILPPLAAGGTTSVSATDGGLTMQLKAGTEIRLGDAAHLVDKLRAMVAVLGALAGQPVNYVDVSVPSNPVAG
jgi:cell division protein FtsQ